MDKKLNQDITGNLLRGNDLTLCTNDNGNELLLKNHTIDFIVSSIGFDLYNMFCNISNIELDLIEKDSSISEIVSVFLTVFTNCDTVKYNSQLHDFQVFFDDVNYIMIDKERLSYIFFLFRQMYFVPESEKVEKEQMTEKQRKMFEQINDFKNKAKKDVEITIESIIESITVKHNSYNLFNIWDLKVYQLMRTYCRINHIDSYENTLFGIYTGNVDSEKISFEKINWSIRI